MRAAPILAAERVFSLVSGCPGDRGRLRWLLMLQAYIDGSGNGRPDSLVLAGYVASAEVWRDFSTEWKAHVDLAGLRRFKMSEMTGRPEIAASFFRIIENHNLTAAVSITVDTAGLRKVVREIVPAADIEAEHLDNPYFIALRAIIEGLAALQDQVGISEPVDFIFDDQSEKAYIAEIWDFLRAAAHRDIKSKIGASPIFRDDVDFMPLQAADLYAYWVRKWHLEGRGDRLNVPFPWKVRRKFNIVNLEITEGHLRKSFSDASMTALHTSRKLATFKDKSQAVRWLENRYEGIRMTLPDPSSPLNWGG
jgi:hypothetical protein